MKIQMLAVGAAVGTILLGGTVCAAAAERPGAGAIVLNPQNESIRLEIGRAIDKGVRWLEQNQDAEGWWSSADHPALTALALMALQGAPEDTRLDDEILGKGYAFLLSCAKADGSIYGKKAYLNYNTALSVMALLAAEKPEYKPVILRARNYIVGLQSDFGQPGELDDPMDGGIGYGSRPHSDMSNTLAALEALYHSRRLLEDEALTGAKELNWDAALRFIQNCQNLPEYNTLEWASGDPANRGGFVYFPGHSMAGTTNLPSGRVALRSYGSISYAGMLSYIYADLKPDDPRVSAVIDWLGENYTLEENPGMGQQGLYFYFHTMAKALHRAGLDKLEGPGDREIDWRKDLAFRLMNLQKADGSWQNVTARWWESDPVLVTAYCVLALEYIERGM